ncbi:MAG: GldG family protein, partial [Rhodothermales bacterium]
MKRDWTSRTTLLLVGLILIVVNLIGVNLFFRLDLTDDEVYSLSDASIRLVENLEDPVTLTAYFTENLPAPYGSNRRFLRDKLADYRAYGGANVHYRLIDPSADEELQEEAQRYGIPAVQIQVIEQDNVQLKNAFMGLVVEYGGERKAIPVVQDLSTLEYDITSAIRGLTRGELPVVGFLTGHGEPGLFEDLQILGEELRRNYQVQEVSIADSSLTPRPDVLMIVAPTDSLTDSELRVLDGYVQDGGHLAFLMNQVMADLQTQQAQLHSVNLEPLLSSYGTGLNPNLIMDEQSSAITIQRRQGFFNVTQQIRYAFLPIVTRFNRENMMVSRLGEVMFYFVSSIDTAQTLPEGVLFEP